MPAAAAVIRKVVQTSQFDEREHPEWTLPGAFAGRYSPWSSHLHIGRLARLVRRIGRKSNHGGGPIPGSAAAGFRPERGPLRLLSVRRLALPDPARPGDGAAYRLRGRADRRPPLARTLAGSRGTTPLDGIERTRGQGRTGERPDRAKLAGQQGLSRAHRPGATRPGDLRGSDPRCARRRQ